MSTSSSTPSVPHTGSAVVWSGKPWIVPNAVLLTVLIVILAVAVVWFEVYIGIALELLIGLQIAVWTVLVLFAVWLIGILRLLLIRASSSYLLRRDSLEVRLGIISTRTFVVVPSGFSDLDVFMSAVGRLVNSGDIRVNAQSEHEICMKMVRHPQTVAAQIREIMGKPIVRIEEHDRV